MAQQSRSPYNQENDLNAAHAKDAVGAYGYTVSEINDGRYEVIQFTSNTVTVIFDRVKVTETEPQAPPRPPDSRSPSELRRSTSMMGSRFGDSFRWLRWHYRCNSGIIEFPNRLVYEGRIRVHTSLGGIVLSVKGNIPDILRPDKPAVFIDVPSIESRGDGSKFNDLETEAMAGVLTSLLEASAPVSSVGVITPLGARAQKNKRVLN